MRHKTNKILTLSIAIFLLFACNKQTKKATVSTKNDYAKGFQLTTHDNYKKLSVFNPWQKAKDIQIDYYLVNRNQQLPDSLKDKTVIPVPIKRVICLSTTQIAYLDAIEEANSIVGVSGADYVSNKTVRENIAEKKVVDIGFGENLNFELIVQQQPDLVFAYGVSGEAVNFSNKLKELNIPVVFIAEYLESSPLAKAEWVKAIAAFYNKEKVAEDFYNRIMTDYLATKEKAQQYNESPTILVGSPFKDTWWTPGGDSYMAKLIEDAGATYVGNKHKGRESYVVSFENAMIWAEKADFWINMSNYQSKKELLNADERFSKFKVLENGSLYNNVKRTNVSGGNDFWESGTVFPNLILKDLVHIFHTDKPKQDSLHYYIQLN